MAGFWQRLKRLFRGSSARDDERDSHLPLALESAGKEADKTEGERKVYESSGVVILEDPTLADSQDQDASTDSAQASPVKEKTATPAEVASSESAEQSEPAAATQTKPAAPEKKETNSKPEPEPAASPGPSEQADSAETPVEPVVEPDRKLPVQGVKTADICAANGEETYGAPAIDRTPGRKLICLLYTSDAATKA